MLFFQKLLSPSSFVDWSGTKSVKSYFSPLIFPCLLNPVEKSYSELQTAHDLEL